MSLSQNAQTIVTSLVNAIKGQISSHYNITGNSSTKGHVQAGGVPQSIGDSLSAGTDNGYYARADHVHTVQTSHVTDTSTYPNIGTSQNAKQNEINSAIDEKIGRIPTSTSQLNNDSGFLTSHQTVNSWQQVSGVTDGTLYANTALKLAFLQIWKSNGYNYAKSNTYYTIATIPSGYRPKVAVNLSFTSTSEWGHVLTNGAVEVARSTTGSVNVSCSAMWCY